MYPMSPSQALHAAPARKTAARLFLLFDQPIRNTAISIGKGFPLLVALVL